MSLLSLSVQKKTLIFYFFLKPAIIPESVRMQSVVFPNLDNNSFRYLKESKLNKKV